MSSRGKITYTSLDHVRDVRSVGVLSGFDGLCDLWTKNAMGYA